MPTYPSSHAPHTAAPVESSHVECLSHPPFCFEQLPLLSTHLVSPLPKYPAGQGPHVRPPGTFTHSVLRSHPPFCFAHSSTSAHVAPSPSYPAGQGPHVRPPTTFVHRTKGEHPPLTRVRSAHSSTSTHPEPPALGSTPSPSYPEGHAPHVTDPGSAVHETRGDKLHPPLFTKQRSSSAATSWFDARAVDVDETGAYSRPCFE